MRVRLIASRPALRLKRCALRSVSSLAGLATSDCQDRPPSAGATRVTEAAESSATKVPRPTVEATKPAASRSAYARTTVLRFVLSSVARSRVGGSRKPAGNAPAQNAGDDLVEELLVERLAAGFGEGNARAAFHWRPRDWSSDSSKDMTNIGPSSGFLCIHVSPISIHT